MPERKDGARPARDNPAVLPPIEFPEALPVVLSAKARPVTPKYGEVSEAIRTNMNAFLAGTKTADAALADMKGKLGPVFGQ